MSQALCLGAPASGQGKTLVAAGLARWLRKQGLSVRAFKTGPDFLDPMLLAQASGAPVYNLDGWMGGIAHCRDLLQSAAAEADFLLLEGVMGLFDGPCSTADLAEALGLPVAAVIDATGMGQSFGAVALGLARYRPALAFRGVLANRVAGARHAAMLQEGLPADIAYLGGLPRTPQLALPSRHLGLVQAEEIAELEDLLEYSAAAVGQTELAEAALPWSAAPAEAGDTPPPLLQGRRIAVARDAAFSFLYPANLDCLRALGAQLAFFSPLADAALPPADAVYLPGGYPELHLDQLAGNHAMRQALRQHAAAGKPLYAECGGLLYLLEQLAAADGQAAPMLGLLPGQARLGNSLAALGYQTLPLVQGELRGHTFHYSRLETPLAPAVQAIPQRPGQTGEALFRHGSIVASYLHLYFPSNPLAAASLFIAR